MPSVSQMNRIPLPGRRWAPNGIDLAERQERLGDLDGDRLLVEIGPGRQVRLVASVAQRDHEQVVALGMGEAGDRAADAPRRQLLDGRRHLHGGQATGRPGSAVAAASLRRHDALPRPRAWRSASCRPGPNNAITDVAGVRVGTVTLIEGEGPLVVGQGPVRTGVTVIVPHDGDRRLARCSPAATR